MLHKEILKQLFPIEMGGVFDTDCAIEGEALDTAVARAEQLLGEMFPDLATESIQEWERICAILPPVDATLQSRRSKIIQELRKTGSMTAQYYIDLAASMGYTVTIDEPFAIEGPHVWRITFTELPTYEFYADESCAEELLLDWPSQSVAEGLFQDLKPAHSRLIIAYA